MVCPQHAALVPVPPAGKRDRLADGGPALVRESELIPELASDLWLLIHPDLRRVERIRALRDYLVDAFSQLSIQRRLAGDAG